ncbi:MAG: DUF2191 domain-containing protein [Actinomycetota bacterium]
MSKRLVDIDEGLLEAARKKLGTETIKETVNRALEQASGQRDREIDKSLDFLASMEFDPRKAAWH